MHPHLPPFLKNDRLSPQNYRKNCNIIFGIGNDPPSLEVFQKFIQIRTSDHPLRRIYLTTFIFTYEPDLKYLLQTLNSSIFPCTCNQEGNLFQVTVKLRLHRGQRWVHWLGCVGPTTLSGGRPRGASGRPAGGRPAPGPPPTRSDPLLGADLDPPVLPSHIYRLVINYMALLRPSN